jgi:hypothetical protein
VLIVEVEPMQQTEACARHCIESVSLLYVFICHIEELFFYVLFLELTSTSLGEMVT